MPINDCERFNNMYQATGLVPSPLYYNFDERLFFNKLYPLFVLRSRLGCSSQSNPFPISRRYGGLVFVSRRSAELEPPARPGLCSSRPSCTHAEQKLCVMQGYLLWPYPCWEGGDFCPNWKTGKNLKKREKKKKEKSDKTYVKIPLWSLNDRKKIHKIRGDHSS